MRDGGVALDVALQEEGGWQAVCPHGRGYVWTRKQAGIAAHGTVALDGGRRARSRRSRSSTTPPATTHASPSGAGPPASAWTPPATPLAFNLVQGVNDPPSGSERAVWIAGEPREAPPVTFAPDLTRIDAADGSRLRFVAEAQRSRRERLLLVGSDYRAPFGTFSGTLPGGVALARGVGVIEHHRARW